MTDEYPMRINKYMAQEGYSTRRGADELIERKKVLINGRIAVVGDKVNEGDKVEVRGVISKTLHYYAYNKPAGVISHSPQGDEDEIVALLPKELRSMGLFPVGRLDKASHGLIVLTNDGRITRRMLSPEFEHEKEYVVKTKLPLRKNFKERMEKGVNIEGYETKPTKVSIRGEKTFAVTLTEGKKHQIRRMVVALYNEVEDLKRTRVMNIQLGSLGAGEARPIEGKELHLLLEKLGLG